MTLKTMFCAVAFFLLAIGVAFAAGAAGRAAASAVLTGAAAPGCGYSLNSAVTNDLHIVYGCRTTRTAVAAVRDYIRT